MVAKPGTPHFGEYPEYQTKDVTHLQTGKDFDKIHFLFDPSQLGREMGSTEGEAPKCGWEKANRNTDYMCNHDGFSGGNSHNLNMDEQKVLKNTIYQSRIEYADDCCGKNYGSDERSV